MVYFKANTVSQSATLRRNITNLEKKYSELEKKHAFSMELCEGMMKRVTNTEISIGLMRSRFESSPAQWFDLTEEGGEVDVLEAPITLGSHIVGSPKPDPELTWESVQEGINSMATTWVDSLVGEELDIAPK